KETRKTPAVSLNLAMKAGSICDPLPLPGAMSLLARVIDRGTATRSASDIAEALDNRGASLNVVISRHLCSLICTCLAEDFEPVLALIADIIKAPSFPETEIATRQGEIVTAIRQDEDNPAVQAVDRLLNLLYGADHPYGRPYKGLAQAVEAATRDDLVALHAARFAPTELTAVIVGDVDASLAIDTAATLFSDWRTAVPPVITLSRPVPAAGRRHVVIPMMNKAQADIAY